MIKNLLFFLAFLLTLSIMTYCNKIFFIEGAGVITGVDAGISTLENDLDGNGVLDDLEFFPMCEHGRASTVKLLTADHSQNTENCETCNPGYAKKLSTSGFMVCEAISYVCTNGDEAFTDGNAPNSNTENCETCNPGYAKKLSTSGFMVCEAISYVCTNGDEAFTDGNAPNSNTENCARCDVGYVLLPVSMDVESFMECPLDTDKDGMPDNAFYGKSGDTDDDNDGSPDTTDVDDDGDGLIEIHTLNDLATIRYDLDGEGSDDDSSNTDMRTLGNTGCGGLNNVTACIGYELMQNLDFRNSSSYPTMNAMNTDWLPDPSLLGNTSINLNFSSLAEASSEAGWIPIGNSSNQFSATFEGNGFTISNLYVRRSTRVGFFAETSSSAKIRNIGLLGGAIFGGGASDIVGSLVGYNRGSITASYATGNIFGGGDFDAVGGLVGLNDGGSITASYATGKVDGGTGTDYVGGLVGLESNSSSITASYATGKVDGGLDGDFGVGGLLGAIGAGGNITASYATGSVVGDAGVDRVGGLVGFVGVGVDVIQITASYATGSVVGGAGADYVGGLVGFGSSSIEFTASYAFGSVDTSDTSDTLDTSGTTLPMDVTRANELMSDNSGTGWNIAWDFADRVTPALRYADYDGTGSSDDVDYCELFLPLNIDCGATLLPGPNKVRVRE